MSSSETSKLSDFESNRPDSQTVTFGERDSRKDDMHEQIEEWIDDLTELTDEARASEEFQEWLDVQASFHDYSLNNSLLIKLQKPDATKVAGYRTWQEDFDRQVQEGEDAIWIWAPITAPACPKCGNAESYHEKMDCEYDETPPEEWSTDVVAFRPVSVFDISQTEGEPLPETGFETTVYGDGAELWPAVEETASTVEVDLDVVAPDQWTDGSADGVCDYQAGSAGSVAEVRVKNRSNLADLSSTTIHEYAHAMLHGDFDEQERSMREVEAEGTAYVVCRYFGLDTSNSAFYLASWAGEETEAIRERLNRISRTSQELIEAIESSMESMDE